MEIEMKVPITEKQLNGIINLITSVAQGGKFKDSPDTTVSKTIEHLKKTDSYFRLSNAPIDTSRVVRMRSIGLFPTSTIEHILYHGTNKYTPSTLGVACKTWFTVKQKSVKPTGEEVNDEREVELAGDSLTKQFESCLELMGYECYFNKIKYTYGFYIQLKSTDMGDRPMVYHVEVERVESGDKSVLYVEIENTDSDDSIDSEIILKQIKQIFNLLGLDPEKADSRSWIKILKGDN